MNRSIRLALAALCGVFLAVPAFAANYVFNGNITTGAQYDTYTIPLNRGDFVDAVVTCASPPNNTLDSVLSMYHPFVSATDTSLSRFYDDDGGPDVCGGFHDSKLSVVADLGGDWTVRVDGFGSATGAYTLTINVRPGYNGIPTLSEYGLIALGLLLAAFGVRRLRKT